MDYKKKYIKYKKKYLLQEGRGVELSGVKTIKYKSIDGTQSEFFVNKSYDLYEQIKNHFIRIGILNDTTTIALLNDIDIIYNDEESTFNKKKVIELIEQNIIFTLVIYKKSNS